MSQNTQRTTMDSLLRGTLWLVLFPFVQLRLDSLTCPDSCMCGALGFVSCVGESITDVPAELPFQTSLLLLNGTNMNVINERSLENLEFLTRFILTYSHLHTIHPQAFHIAPQLLSVKLSNNDLSSLPVGVFRPMTSLQQLYLDGNQLEVIAPDMVQGMAGLQDLDLNSNRLTNLTSDVFNGLTNLTFLNLGKNTIKKLPPTIFHSLTQLRSLILYKNELEELEAGIFDDLVNLEELKIHHNKIPSLPPKVFWPLRNLRTLSLSSNRLQAIPEKSFYYMSNLTHLTIFKNPLLSLPDELMGHMPFMTEFYLYATNLITVPGNLFANMTGLQRLNLHFNEKLRELPSDLFCCLPSLQKLSLKTNNLLHLHPDLFSRLKNLSLLYLNENELESLPEGIFQDLVSISIIDLSANHLKALPGAIFSSNRALRVLKLSGNPWDCTCNIRDIAKWIRQNEHVLQDRDDVMCHTPKYQLLRTLGSLRDEEFKLCDIIVVTETTTSEPVPTHKDLEAEITTIPGPIWSTASTTGPTTAARSTTPKPSAMETPSDAEPATTESTSSRKLWSPTFSDILVVEQGPEFVHHNRQKDWVYVWFLPSNAGFLMFCHILLVATGLFLILASMYGMFRLNKLMEELNAECAHLQG